MNEETRGMQTDLRTTYVSEVARIKEAIGNLAKGQPVPDRTVLNVLIRNGYAIRVEGGARLTERGQRFARAMRRYRRLV